MNKTFKIHPGDNVIVALLPINAGDVISFDGGQVIMLESVDMGSKIAIRPVNTNSMIVKYGVAIGHATESIKAGAWVHTHNVKTNLSGTEEYRYEPKLNEALACTQDRTIQAYRRESGEIAVRNEIWVIPTVGCVNGIAKQIVERFKKMHSPLLIDGVHFLSHTYGCSQLGEDHENTRQILANMVNHPHAGGALVIGLGCENNQVDPFKKVVGAVDNNRVQYMVAQNEDDEIQKGIEQLEHIYKTVSQDKRQAVSIGKLKVGLECGGSDGLSGITANPLIGRFSDHLIGQGGTSVLTEVPEMFGAEHILFERCINQDVFDKAVLMINNFKQYFIEHNQPIYENPSPGNKKGGITSLEDKSLGCTQKAGQSAIMDVLKYGERLSVQGLNLLSAPGNDAIATSALAASGCHIVLFSTGRGTPYGGFVPTLKIATNSALANKKPHWIDFNAGELLEGQSMDDMLESFIKKIVDITNGSPTCNENNDFRELAIFKSGVTL